MSDIAAGTYPLDPRRRGEVGAPSVFLVKISDGSWRCYRKADDDSDEVATIAGTGATKREALHAARVAAGLGDVAGEACDQYFGSMKGPCYQCRWAYEQHPERGAPQSE